MSNNKQTSVEWLANFFQSGVTSREEWLQAIEQAKAMHKQETMDFAAEWSVCQLRSDKIWHLDDLYNEKFTDNI